MGGKSSKTQKGSGSSRKKEPILGKPVEDIKKLYTMGDELGRGSFGKTFSCREISTGERYACKSISKRTLKTEEDKEAVKTEIDIMRHVSGHDNIVQVKSVHEDEKSVHIVMELCTGGELFDRVKTLFDSRDYYSEKVAAKIIAQLVKAIEICHSMDVVHRDIKPENFLFSSEDEDAVLKAIDFGCSAYVKEGSELKKQIISGDYYTAPEVVRKESYGKEIDIWGAGVILYILLCGKAPFSNETEIKGGDLDFHSSPWLKLTVSARNLIQRMLKTDPKERITAQGVLAHPWIIKEAPDTPLDNVVLLNMKQFQVMNKLKKLALKVIAESLSEEVKGLKTMFENMDTDKSGSITCEELKTGLARLGSKLSETEVKQLMEAADVDGNGTIDYIEFVSAMMHRHRLVRKENLYQEFQYFDKDGSGYITIDEWEKAMEEHGKGDATNIKDIISEVDKDNNGKIDYEEFCTMIRNAT